MSEKELAESVENWTLQSEHVVHLLNQHKLALKKEDMAKHR